ISSWKFDLKANPNYSKFISCKSKIKSATLKLGLMCPIKHGQICGGDIFTDEIKIGTLPKKRLSELHSFIGQPSGVLEVNLLDYFTESEIINQIRLGRGVLPMQYQDDALITYANIDIVAEHTAP
ncbi:MAG: hypothetical protein AAFV71_32270, partial [Cyanobacteria bacterium J06633_8]